LNLEDKDTTILRNVGNHPPNNIATHHRRLECSTSTLVITSYIAQELHFSKRMMMMMMTVANRDPAVRLSTNAKNATLYVPLEVTYGSGFAIA